MTHKDIAERIDEAFADAHHAAKNYRAGDPSIPPSARASYELGYLQSRLGRLRAELRREPCRTNP